ncbi:DUF1800 domain-containing protein [Silvibacterium dinghuense]|uniref:DUF1800 domain-containing protein n=1 Tax=Silvibacterium dinghuense TaxID=1560006 RepID=A0A4Q1SHX9_9BACT|nr:DUF1800 domain-containing protein [Silvibacterium dinghuense]RXS96995.1 DUF1800 domain-containing protein [Silvibacterium dinghuense]GGG95328.1 hypothetical protein GCM10011586_07940 [Silvibacterium dinghuense]
MPVPSPRALSGVLLSSLLAVSLYGQTAGTAGHHGSGHHAATSEPPSAPLNNHELAAQMLARFTFGAQPGEVDAVAKLGPDAWFAQQLQPDTIPDPAVDRAMGSFPSLYLPPSELLVRFPSNFFIRQIAEGKRPLPTDPALRPIYETLLWKYQQRQAQQAAVAAGTAQEPTDDQKKQQRQASAHQAQALADQMLAVPRAQRMQAIFALPVEQRATLAEFVPDPQKGLLLRDFNTREKEQFAVLAGGPDALHVIDGELQQAKLLRAVASQRQLLEVMTDFWFNHFNVDIRKDAAQWYTPTYERDAIRAHALGKFSDLLLATAQHPAMLYYLDNWSSFGPDSRAGGKTNKKGAERGLNENYGREVMELHTVGVDGGYSQADVTNLSKILTGWTIDQPQQGGGFLFDERRHEPGSIPWFGHTVQDNGFEEGRQALLWLAAQPQTAHHISFQLAQRFIADDPPPALVDRMTKTWLATGGDIRQVLLTMVHSPEFRSRRYTHNLVKTPLGFVASTLRATDTDVATTPGSLGALTQVIAQMGEPLYQDQPPTGYATTADHWMNTAALVSRLNFSLQFTQGKIGGLHFDAPRLLAEGLLARPAETPRAMRTPYGEKTVALTTSTLPAGQIPSGQDEALALMEQMLLSGQISEKTSAVIRHELSMPVTAGTGANANMPAPQSTQPQDPAQALNTIAALLLGSPEFQLY